MIGKVEGGFDVRLGYLCVVRRVRSDASDSGNTAAACCVQMMESCSSSLNMTQLLSELTQLQQQLNQQQLNQFSSFG